MKFSGRQTDPGTDQISKAEGGGTGTPL